MYRTPTRITIVILVVLLFTALPAAAQGPTDSHPTSRLTPVVIFPGYGGAVLEVQVHNQTVAPECPRSGAFEFTFFPAHPSVEFSQICQDKLLTLRYDFDSRKPAGAKGGPGWRVSNQPGVQVKLVDYGKTENSPLYEMLYQFLEQAGYQRNVNIRVAGYDLRLTPDLGGFMERTKKLIEETYRDNGNTPVHLVGHSNGPLYAQYFLTHVSQPWKNKYIHGFTPFAGNWPGQGLLYMWLFTGFNIPTATAPTDPQNAATSATMFESWPSTYMSAADPAYFGDQEVVIRLVPGGTEYTPRDAPQMFMDAGLTLAPKISPYYFGFVKFQPPNFPFVDTYAEKGSGLETIVGVELPDITFGQPLPATPVWITRDGDSNQEDITNDAVAVWETMPCYRFEFYDNPGLGHMDFAFSATAVWERLLEHLQQPRSQCKLR